MKDAGYLVILIYFIVSLLIVGGVLYVVDKLPINGTIKTIIQVASVVGVAIFWLVQLAHFVG